jgi:hypothetical protein
MSALPPKADIGEAKVPLPTYFLPTKSISADMPT